MKTQILPHFQQLVAAAGSNYHLAKVTHNRVVKPRYVVITDYSNEAGDKNNLFLADAKEGRFGEQ